MRVETTDDVDDQIIDDLPITFKEFYETVPPGQGRCISDVAKYQESAYFLSLPEISLHCSDSACNGNRIFSTSIRKFLPIEKATDIYVEYFCQNCRRGIKTYSLMVWFDSEKWYATKYGELPSFGPPTPAKMLTLIRGEKELFAYGRRCENQGLGIGAFVYYRRVIESQKGRIFDELIRVIKRVSPSDAALLQDLEIAKKEQRFTSAVGAIKHAIPQSLLINGHNPLLMLHNALSQGVHGLSDAQCLSLASNVRTVLAEFAERLDVALKDDKAITDAVNALMNIGIKK